MYKNIITYRGVFLYYIYNIHNFVQTVERLLHSSRIVLISIIKNGRDSPVRPFMLLNYKMTI